MTNTTKVALAGDWHGAFQWTRHALHTLGQAGIKRVFHLGDFSIGYEGWADYVNICESILKYYDMELWVTPGNHENWDVLDAYPYLAGQHWVSPHLVILERNARWKLPYEDEDGDIQFRSFLSLGGAQSVDFQGRTEGVDWFPNECMTLADAQRAAREGHADVMLCHDAPDGGTLRVQQILDTPQSMWSREALRRAAVHRNLMNMAVYGCYDTDGNTLPGVIPKVFAHGHMHAYDVRLTDDTLFLSLGCNNQQGNLMLLDLEDLTAEELPIIREPEQIQVLEYRRKKANRLARIQRKRMDESAT